MRIFILFFCVLFISCKNEIQKIPICVISLNNSEYKQLYLGDSLQKVLKAFNFKFSVTEYDWGTRYPMYYFDSEDFYVSFHFRKNQLVFSEIKIKNETKNIKITCSNDTSDHRTYYSIDAKDFGYKYNPYELELPESLK